MPSNPHNQFSFRDARLADFYCASHPSKSRSMLAKQDLQRYRALLEQIIKTLALSEEEALILWSNLKIFKTSNAYALDDLRESVIMRLWNQEQRILAERVFSWSFTQWMAAIDACDRVEENKERTPEQLSKELKEAKLYEQI